VARTAPVPNIPPIPGMCPSVAVMGGGGGGGGGSGNGAGDGSGDGSGSGDGNGDGANGDGTGAGSCGNGSAGSCTNCSSGTSAGDPIDCITGEVFTIPKTDVFLPGPFNFVLDRKYSSFNRREDVGLGYGWRHTLAWGAHIRRGEIHFHTGTGATIDFPKLEVGASAALQGWGLLRTPEAYVLRPGDEFIHFFTPDENDPSRLLLRRISYRNLGTFELLYDRGRLVKVIDAAARTIVFARGGDGRIASISVAEPSGTSLIFARYRYDGAGNLVEAVDADGHAWLYDYDDDRRLIRMHVPTGPVFHFHYDREGRCIETYGVRPDGQREPALGKDVADVLADGSPAKGIYHAKLDFSGDEYSEAIDSMQIRRFFKGVGNKAAKSINGRGGVTTRTYDPAGNVTSLTDANGAKWTFAYDALGNLVDRTDPEGRRLRFDRDAEGRLVKLTDALGGVIEYGRDRYGHVEWAKNQKDALFRFKYDDRGLLKQEIFPDGTSNLYERDGHGNVVRKTTKNGAQIRYAYDFYGRLLWEQLQDGRTFTYSYSPGGKMVGVVDQIGRSKRYENDAFGNMTMVSLPDGTVTRFERGGLGWMVAIVRPNGAVIRREFNREGKIVAVINEAGERYELTYSPSGAVMAERAFDGTVRRYVRDPRDYIVAVVDDDGKTEIERNKLGQIVELTAPDGEKETLRYDQSGKLVALSNPSARFAWVRDAVGDIVRETLEYGGQTYTVDSTRDILGRRQILTTSLGHTVESKLDALGEVASLSVDGSEIERFTRDAMGWPTRRDLAGGGAIVDEHDGAARLRHRFVIPVDAATRPAGQPDWVGAQPKGTVDKTFQYTPISEVASVTTAADGTTEYEYDLRRNLVARRARAETELFSYDSRNNPYETGPNAPARTYGPGSSLELHGASQLVHDKKGRVVEKRDRRADGHDDVTKYHYNGREQLSAVDLPNGQRAEYGYDGIARRVFKRLIAVEPTGKIRELSTTHYVWDQDSIVHEIQKRPGAQPNVSTFLYETNTNFVPLAHRRAGGAWMHYVHAVNGTPEEIVDGRGALAGTSKASAYGLTQWSRESTPFRFPGQLEDQETGLHYNRFRTYDPATGRYLTKDPLGTAGEFNAYAYGPNPVGWIDPLGLQHHMDVEGPPGWHGSPRPHSTGPNEATAGRGFDYDSGFHGLGPGGPAAGSDLGYRSRCHSEQRFAADLQATGTQFQGEHFDLHGRLPPCPNCHRALQNAANSSGATVDYHWTHPEHGPQVMQYRPNQPPNPIGDSAGRLAGAYGMEETAPGERRNNHAYDNWGGANTAYNNESAGIGDAPDQRPWK
jgi:RHS repeat-associated protein